MVPALALLHLSQRLVRADASFNLKAANEQEDEQQMSSMLAVLGWIERRDRERLHRSAIGFYILLPTEV